MSLLKLNTSLGITFRGNDQKYQPWVVMNKVKDKIIHTKEDILKDGNGEVFGSLNVSYNEKRNQ